MISEPGVGKTTLLVDAVREVEKHLEQQDPDAVCKRPLLAHLSGTNRCWDEVLGQWEERVGALIAELGTIARWKSWCDT